MNPSETQNRVNEFDGLRALAVTLVFLYHYEESMFKYGWAGVDLFFAISGFVITLQCHTLISSRTKIEFIKEFYIRRTTRIFPLYYGLLLALLVAAFGADLLLNSGALGSISVSADSLWKNALYLTNLYIVADGYQSVAYGITWSLAVEEHFYLIYPFLFVKYRNKKFTLVLVLCILLTIALRLFLSFHMEFPGRLYYLTFSRFDGLLFGCLAAHLYLKGFRHKMIPILAVVLSVTAVYLTITYKFNSPIMYQVGYSVIPAATATLMFWISDARPVLLSKLLASRPMVFIGSISYGMYLFHIWIIKLGELIEARVILSRVFGENLAFWLLMLFEFTITVAISYASFQFFEKASRKYLNNKLALMLFPSAQSTSGKL